MYMKKYYLLLLLAAISLQSAAQTVVRGSVRNASGEPLVGANVYIRGTSTGTQADAEGLFVLQLPAGAQAPVVVVSSIGYTPKEIVIGSQTTFDVVLADDLQVLQEVVITGYTAQDRGKITGAVNTVTAQELTNVPVPTIDQALQGRAPGVVVSQNTGAPGEGVSIRIRGIGSI